MKCFLLASPPLALSAFAAQPPGSRGRAPLHRAPPAAHAAQTATASAQERPFLPFTFNSNFSSGITPFPC